MQPSNLRCKRRQYDPGRPARLPYEIGPGGDPADGIARERFQVREAVDHSCEFVEGAKRGPCQIQHRDRREGGEKCREARMERDVRQQLELRRVRLGFSRIPFRGAFGQVRDVYLLEVGQRLGEDDGEEREYAGRGV